MLINLFSLVFFPLGLTTLSSLFIEAITFQTERDRYLVSPLTHSKQLWNLKKIILPSIP